MKYNIRDISRNGHSLYFARSREVCDVSAVSTTPRLGNPMNHSIIQPFISTLLIFTLGKVRRTAMHIQRNIFFSTDAPQIGKWEAVNIH